MASAEEDFEGLRALAQRLQLEEKEAESFINSSMQRLGYKPLMSWGEPDPQEGEGGGGGDFFSGKRQQRQQRDVSGGRQQPQKRASGQPWGYGE